MSKYSLGQRVCEKIRDVINWGTIVQISPAEKYLIKWQPNDDSGEYGTWHGWREKQDLIPEGDPDMDLKEIL